MKQNMPWVLIPAYQPDQRLVELVARLTREFGLEVIIVNDGSSASCNPVFEALETMDAVRVVRHAVNRGKGQSLKTGINHYLLHAPAENPGLVTADADGQHLPEDIFKVMQAGGAEGTVTLGVRQFRNTVPLRSRFGNILTRWVFKALLGLQVSDTQTGLRFLPRRVLPRLLGIRYDRYEYELAMLASIVRSGEAVREVPIETIYIDGNKSSHFNPLVDSLKIYYVFLRFSAVSMLTAALDFVVFWIAHLLSGSILASIMVARVVAGTFNYTTSRRWVFNSNAPVGLELTKYCLLVILLMAVSWFLTESIYRFLGGHVLVAKATAETALFLTSFVVQNFTVFDKRKVVNEE